MEQRKAFSIVEVMIAVTAVGVLAAISLLSVSHVVESTREQKLAADVDLLNRSIVAHLASGGSLDGLEDPDEVIAALKKKSANADRVAGLSGAKVDIGLTFEKQSEEEASKLSWRVYWDASAKRFVLAREGDRPGIKAFSIDATLANQDPGESDHHSGMLYADEDRWIWDYKDTPNPEGPGVSTIPTTEVGETGVLPVTGSSPPSSSGAGDLLAAPIFSHETGIYRASSFDLPLTLGNPNPEGTSEIYYSVDYGPWKLYTGTLSVPPSATVSGQAIATTDNYSNSNRVDHDYQIQSVPLVPPAIVPDVAVLGVVTDREAVITLVNPNPPGSSKVEYRIAGGPWQEYTVPFLLSRDDYPTGALVQARSVPIESHFLASTTSLESVGARPLSVAGTADGAFHTPVGGKHMKTNLGPKDSGRYFEWGKDTGSRNVKLSRSWLSYQSTPLLPVGAGTRFELGTLSYYNGRILGNTGADQVSFALDLALEIAGVGLSRAFDFDLGLIDVRNRGNNPWEDADFVQIDQPVATERIEIGDALFEFQLEFGETTPNGISYFDEFHVIEEESASTKLYGTLREIGPIGFNLAP